MLLQTDKNLHPVIQKTGCYFLTLGYFVEKCFLHTFTADDINTIFNMCIKYNAVNEECRIISPDFILKKFLESAGIKTSKIMQIGQLNEGKETYWGWVGSDHTAECVAAMEIIHGKYSTHWVSINNMNEKLIDYDPYNNKRIGDTTTAKRFVFYKIFRRG